MMPHSIGNAHAYSQQDGFKNAMIRAGLVLEGSAIADGKIHRFKADGDKRPNSWYVLFGNAGKFGNWRTGLRESWHRDGTNTNQNIKSTAKLKTAQRNARKELVLQYQKQSVLALERLRSAVPAHDHPYLRMKNVKAHGTLADGKTLLIPMRIGKKVWSVQSIYPNGQKLFMKGAKAKGCYFAIGSLGKRLWIAEGFSTGATVHELTGDPVACAMYGDNMKNVAAWFQAQHPNIELLIAADAGHIGIRYGTAAMKAGLATRMVYPDFKPDEDGSDWNDYRYSYGSSQAFYHLKNREPQ